MTLGRLALAFTILSLLGFGGGNAILPQMHADVVDRFHWIGSAEFSRFYALGRLAPGPTTTMAALVGYRVAGFAGALVAAVAIFVPAGIVVYALGGIWQRLYGNPWRDLFAKAIAPVVLGLVWASVGTIGAGAVDGWITGGIAVVVTGLLLRTEINGSYVILAGGVVGALALR